MEIALLLWRTAKMLNEEFVKIISATSRVLALLDPVVEKDYYVTQVIQALSTVENDHFRLVFCGGTCLAKAHKVVLRMSEDVDFKIQAKETTASLSKTLFFKELKIFRAQIQSSLILPGLEISTPIVRNSGKYLKIEIYYTSIFPATVGLRPHILLEFTVSDLRLSVEKLSVKTLIEETLKNVSISPPLLIHCVSINETAIEKWVGLTRKIIAIERAYCPDDATLIRHVYDLSAIQLAKKINADFLKLAKTIIKNDADQFRNQHPEYASAPISEIKKSLSLLRNKSIWKERYQKFLEAMVYDRTIALEYTQAIEILEYMSSEVITFISQ